jgi:hypothetical protein
LLGASHSGNFPIRDFHATETSFSTSLRVTPIEGRPAGLPCGRIEIDNNETENSIRPTAIRKKNWLFIGAAKAGSRSAILFTVVKACRRYGIKPFEFLRGVFTRMPETRATE